ncbi:MAG TPA: HAD family phosphatase [Steroidobacteraceae bacterium]|nr:HAD family phosphatase [Steroidobacteraceae bacterium]
MIRNVVFDVGGVLLELRYDPFIRYLAGAGIDMRDLPGWLTKVDLAGHERGELAGEELLARIAAMASRPLDLADLRTRWLDMFERSEEMFALAAGLMQEYRVYLLSNAGDLHWQHFDRLYGLDSLVHGACASFRVKAIKPSADIYRKAEAMFGLDPAATVFIDDLPQNVIGARACGWNAIHHNRPHATRLQLRALGVRLPPPFDRE